MQGHGHLPRPRELPLPASLPPPTCRPVWARPLSCLLYREKTGPLTVPASLRRGARTGSQSSDTGQGALSLLQLHPTNPGPVTCSRGVRFYSWPTGPVHPAWAKQLGQRWTGGPRGLLSRKQRPCFGGGAGPRHCVSPEGRPPPRPPPVPFCLLLSAFQGTEPGEPGACH